MIVKEFRVVNHCTLEEYQVAQLYMVIEASKEETGGGDGVEIHVNEPYDNELGKGQYTKKTYHLSSKVPGWVRALAPAGSLELYEEAWNGYPYCKTETQHVANSRGEQENALNLPPDVLKKRQVQLIDVVNDKIDPKYYKVEHDPTKFHSEKTGRGPLTPNWLQTVEPVMTCYKLVTVEFKWFGLQSRVESFIINTMKSLFTKTHRQLFCLTDNWCELTMPDIRRMEAEVQKELDDKRKNAALSGNKAE